MKRFILLLTNILILSLCVNAQNIDYEARITQFYGSNCGGEWGNEEHTWKGWLSDNVNTTETYSGCIQRNTNGAITQSGTYAVRNQYNVTSTQLISRIDAWEDDMGARCDFNTGFNSDDCRVNQTCTYNFTNPLEYQWTVATNTCGSGDYNMNVYRQYRYSTTTIPNAVDNASVTYSTGGNRPFWGSLGNWSYAGGDCATSGTITHNQTSSFSTTVTCKSQVMFRWRVSSEANYDFLRVYVNGVQEEQISGNVGWALVTLNLPMQANNTIEWRYTKDGSVSDGLDRGFVDQIQFTDANSVNPGVIAGVQTICQEGDPTNLTSNNDGAGHSNLSYQWQYSNNGTTGWTNIAGANGATYDPPSVLNQTRYYRRRIQDACGNEDYSNGIQVTVNPNSTSPTIAPLAGNICPNTTTTLTASGGVVGTGSTVRWYSGPNGTGTMLGTGLTLNVSATANTTYYVRREGICNNSTDESITVNVKQFIYANVGTTSSTDYCTDNAGWHHFYNASDEIILSVNGNLSGATTTPVATINNNGSFYVQNTSSYGTCFEEREYEMQRSWDLNFVGTLNPPYAVRFYYPPAEKTAIETAAANYITANPTCNYSYEYANPQGFYWFKNASGAYTAPTYDQPLHLTGFNGTVNSINYTEFTGIPSFSGGSGGVTLLAPNPLPVELISFSGYNENRQNFLNWSTASEINNDKFEVERSANPQNGFEKIGEVQGAGNSTETLTYQFIDENPMNATNYYRLRQVDFDGKFEYSAIIAINNEFGEQFNIYPNVTTKDVIVNFNHNKKSKLKFVLSDLTGRKMVNVNYPVENGNNSIVINLSKFKAGTYFLSVYEDDEEILKSSKIIKQ